MKYLMAVDQFGNSYLDLVHPRKDLMERLGYSSARKMYMDKADGTKVHVGYVVGQHWCIVYTVERWEKAS